MFPILESDTSLSKILTPKSWSGDHSEASEVLRCLLQTQPYPIHGSWWEDKGSAASAKGLTVLEGETGTPIHKTSKPQAVSSMEKPDGEQNNYLSNSSKPAVEEKAERNLFYFFCEPRV